MKKLSSMLALGMALALTFGMTVSAAESTTTQNPDFKPTESQLTTAQDTIKDLVPVSTVKATDSNGNSVAVTVEPIQPATVAELQSTDVVQKALDKLSDAKTAELAAAVNPKVDPKKNTITVNVSKKPIAAAVIEIPEGADISKGLQVEISLPSFKPAANTSYVVMHLGKNGWEIIMPDAIAEGKVTATFTSLSPVTVNEVTISVVPITVGEDSEDDSDDDSTQASTAAPTTANPATSPKTAETLPIAGVMALICLAGAAVCAGKIRYNK